MRSKSKLGTLINQRLDNTIKIKNLLLTSFKKMSHQNGDLALFLFSIEKADLPQEILDQKIKDFSINN